MNTSSPKSLALPAAAERPIRVLSLGAGVQSTALLLMSLRGELPRVDHAIFADTQDEPQSVYRHLDWLKAECAASGLPLHLVSKGKLIAAATDVRLSAKSGNTYVKTNLPVWVRSPDGRLGLNRRRQCTSDYKLQPIYSWVWNELLKKNRKATVDMWMGISGDESDRMKVSHRNRVRNVYPFCGYHGDAMLPKVWTRRDCVAWLEKHYPDKIVPRSACRYCPYHSNAEWRRLRDSEPREFAQAIKDEHAIQAAWEAATALDGKPFLHRSGISLEQADLSESREDEGLFGMRNECAGMCGV